MTGQLVLYRPNETQVDRQRDLKHTSVDNAVYPLRVRLDRGLFLQQAVELREDWK